MLMHVHIQGILILMLIDPQEREGLIRAKYKVVHKNRFAQKIGYLRKGQSVDVLAGGRKGVIDDEPTSDEIVIRLL
jgi:hypothetical protein